jgi:peptide deformylase
MKIKDLFLISAMVLPMTNGCLSETGGFTPAEKAIIHDADSIMRVLTIEDSLDLEVLRNTSTDLSPEAINSKDFIKLSDLMLRTVIHPSQDGVGLAAPQVGINRRIVAVQRFDKAGEPFEVYPNIHLVWTSDSLAYGPEGCLSVPDRREEVLRSQEIIIEYATADEPEISVRDTVRGFTAVIFQHEIDHLDGLLYTDRL